MAIARAAAEDTPEFRRLKRSFLAAARRECGDSAACLAEKMKQFDAAYGFAVVGAPEQSSPALQRAETPGVNSRAIDSRRPDELKLGTTFVGAPKLYFYNEGFLNGRDAADSETWLVWKFNLQHADDLEETFCVDAATGRIVMRSMDVAHATTRQVYNCALVNPSNPGCRLDTYWVFAGGSDIFLGRSEGQPARGPMPSAAGPPYAGSLDVDNAYNIFLPAIHQYVADRFGRDGANNMGGTGNGTTVPFNITRFFMHADGEPTVGMQICPLHGYAFAGTVSVVYCTGSMTAQAYDLLGHEYGHLISRYRTFSGTTPNSLLMVGPASWILSRNPEV